MEDWEEWGYGRVSSEEQQDDKNALRKQLEQLRNAGCTKLYWDIQSRTTEVREGIELMISDLKKLPKNHKLRFIKFARIDRIGSSNKLYYSLLEAARAKNVKLRALQESADPDTIAGELTIDILLAAAKFEVGMTTQRLKNERQHRKSQGKSHRIAPFGYLVQGDRYVKNQDPCVCLIERKLEFTVSGLTRYLFDTFFKTGSIAGTCRKFHEEFGISVVKSQKWEQAKQVHTIAEEDLSEFIFVPETNNCSLRYPHAGLQFSIPGMRNLLVSPIYAGGTLYNSFEEPTDNYKNEDRSKKKRSRNRKHHDNWDIVWGTHDDQAIITYQEHELVKSMIRGNRNNRWATNDPKDVNPFSRLLNCNNCGASMTRHAKRVTKKDGTIYYYQCRRWRAGGCDNGKMINSLNLEQQVIDLLVREAENLAAKIETEDTPVEEPAELIALRRSLAELEKMPFLNAIENAKEDIRQQINAFVVKTDKPKSMSSEYIIGGFSSSDYWTGLLPADKQRALKECVKRILIEGEFVVKIEFL